MNKLVTPLKALLVAFATLFLFSCDPTPNIVITSPYVEREYFKDEDIAVDVIITDDNGKTTLVQLFADGKLIDELSAKPFNFFIVNGTLAPGKHVFKVIAETQSGKHAEKMREIIILDEKMESDDYVNFWNNAIPPEWKAVGWKVTSGGLHGGFSGIHYITPSDYPNLISTVKRCNHIVFYMKGHGIVKFSANGTLVAQISVGEKFEDPNQNEGQPWERYEYSFPFIQRTFSWEVDPGAAYLGLDAISFSIKE